MTAKTVRLTNFRGTQRATLVTVLEGTGDPKFPYELVSYVLDEFGNAIGKMVALQTHEAEKT